MTIVVTKEDFEEIEYGNHDDWEFVEEGDWVQDYKYQLRTNYVKHKPTGKIYEYSQSRSGSPFTDWYYEEGVPEFNEVIQKERTIVEKYWSYV